MSVGLFRIKGHCQSNCTLFLGLRNVCVERSATLLFHAGHDRQRNINATSTQRMLNAYKPALREYVLAHHYMDTLEFHAIPGATIIDRFGYKDVRGDRDEKGYFLSFLRCFFFFL